MSILTHFSRKRFPYEPLIRVEISRSRLMHNLNEFRKLAPKSIDGKPSIAPVLKSNAYGHGLIEVARALEHEPNIPFYIVDSYFEAIALRAKGFSRPILVIGYTRPETIRDSNLHDVSFTVTSLDTLRAIALHKMDHWQSNSGRIGFRSYNLRFRPKIVRIHIKIDTGMRRQGILPNEIDEAIDLLQRDGAGKRPVVLEGITSHLCDADNDDETFSEAQIRIWNAAVKRFSGEFKTLKHIHLSATDGHRLTPDIDATVSRLGIGLYGLSDNHALTRRLDLLPVLEMKTIITGVKRIKEGETVGYGNTYEAPCDMMIATMPVGYYEGVDRRLSRSNTALGARHAASSGDADDTGGFVLVGTKRIPCPIIGRVSMNITIIDITHLPDTQIGEEAVVISGTTRDPNSIVNIAKACGTIPYEIAVHIPAQLKRIVV
jgi:alanine racemase